MLTPRTTPEALDRHHGARQGLQAVALDDRVDVTEVLRLSDGRRLTYVQPEGSFSNPNGRINEQCLDWLHPPGQGQCCAGGGRGRARWPATCSSCTAAPETSGMALAGMFAHVTAVELDGQLVKAARAGRPLNGVENARFVRLHSHKFCGQLLRPARARGQVVPCGAGGPAPQRAGRGDVALRARVPAHPVHFVQPQGARA